MGIGTVHELRASERTMVIVRWVAVAFALLQVQTYYRPYPGNLHAYALWLVAFLAVGSLMITGAHSMARSERAVRRLARLAFVFDFIAVFAFVVLYTFDVDTAMFTMVYLLPLEGAIRYQRSGALLVMVAATFAYTLREAWGDAHYGFPFLPASISFRMGIGFLIAAVAGQMAWRSMRERTRVEAMYEHEREAADALRAMDDIKNTFLAAVSHELRTPLTSILGFAMTLQDRLGGDSAEPDVGPMLDLLVGEASRLDSLLDDLLDLDRLTRGKVGLDAQAVDLTALATAVARSVSAREQRDIEVAGGPLSFECDERKVERIVENLLANAVKYAPGEAPIVLRVEEQEGGVLIAVEDEGPGVPEPLRISIFEPFRRGVRDVGHSPGTGIGLSLVQRFAELHGGRAWVEPRRGGGSSFRVFLPGDSQQPPPASAQRPSRPA